MQGQLQIWTELSHNDLWKSETSRDINEFNKSAAMETIEKKSSFPNKLFVIEKWIFFSPLDEFCIFYDVLYWYKIFKDQCGSIPSISVDVLDLWQAGVK